MSQDNEQQLQGRQFEVSDGATEVPATAVPDGGYGWVIVISSAIATFWFNGISTSWGVMQAALLRSSSSSTFTLTFVGTLSNTCVVALGVLAVEFLRIFGSRISCMVGFLLFSIGELSSGFVTGSTAGLFCTTGILLGGGASFLFMSANVVTAQYFSGKLGLANGIVKGAGGIGGTVLSLALHALIEKVGIPWTFHILGLAIFVTGMPAAWFMKEYTPIKKSPFLGLSMFRSFPFVSIFLAGATATFAIFVPPYFLPLFAESVGLSTGVGAGLAAGFNLSTTIGRFGAGPLCDRIGPFNTLFLSMLLNSISMLAIWPVSTTLGLLIVFAILNGIANGAFFTTFPTAVASMFESDAAVAMTTASFGWSCGYLLGAPIAALLLRNSGQELTARSFRAAIFYSGGVACAATLFVILARLKRERRLLKRL
jgi:MFS family permease